MYTALLTGWCLYISISNISPYGWFILILLCLSWLVFNFSLYLQRREFLQGIFAAFKVSSFIVGIFLTYGFVTGNLAIQSAINLILYYVIPLIVLSLVICDLGNFKEPSMCLLTCTVPFAFLINITWLVTRGKSTDFRLKRPINFWSNMVNNFICLMCIIGGLGVTVEYIYKSISPTFGFIGFGVFIYIMIPAFIFLTILNFFSTTRKFGLLESSLIVIQSIIPFMYIVYFIFIFIGMSRFAKR